MRKLYLGLALCFLCASVSAQTAAEFLSRAKKENDPKKQIKILTQAVDKYPNLANAYHLRADAYLAAGQTNRALKDYSKTITLRPKDAFRYYARGLAYAQDGQPAPALADFSKAVSLQPSYRSFYLERARAEVALQKYSAALADYRKYLGQREPSDALRREMIPVYLSAYRYKAAAPQIAALRESGDDSAQIHFWQGRILLNEGRHDEAVAAFSKAINRDRGYAQAYRYRGDALREIEEYPAAIEDYTALLALQPDALFFNRRGLMYEELKDFSAAVADYSRAIEMSPKWAVPYNNRGFAKMNLQQWKSAQADLEKAIRLDESAPTPYVNLAGLYWTYKRDKRRTYDNLEKAVKHHFTNYDALYDEAQKGWLFEQINETAQFRAVLYK